MRREPIAPLPAPLKSLSRPGGHPRIALVLYPFRQRNGAVITGGIGAPLATTLVQA